MVCYFPTVCIPSQCHMWGLKVTMFAVSLTILSLGIFTVAVKPRSEKKFPVKPIEEFVRERSYPIETYEIETEDGYILKYHRIPHGKAGPQSGRHGLPVLLVHGILQSSAMWLFMDDALGYLLADAGYDVWLANARGNYQSKKHNKYSSKRGQYGYKEFWDFSFHEMGAKDIPAGIDYILEKTGRPTLTYLGFSMGTTMFWVMAATCGDPCVSKVDSMIAIGPVARPSHMKLLKPLWYITLQTVMLHYKLFHVYELLSYKRETLLLMKMLFSTGENPLSTKLFASSLGHKPEHMHFENAVKGTLYMPSGISLKTAQHYFQMGKQNSFQQFDYGEKENKNRYPNIPQPLPPKYDLKNVNRCPVFFIASDRDDIAAKKDVDWLYDQFPADNKPVHLFKDEIQGFNHMYYLYSKDVPKKLYEKLVQFMIGRKNN